MWIDLQADSERVAHLWFESLFVGCISWVSSASHFALPGSESIFSLSQGCLELDTTEQLACKALSHVCIS